MKTHRDKIPKGIYPVGLYIGIPDQCLRPASNPDEIEDPEYWLDRPDYKGMVELSVMRWRPTELLEGDSWPGEKAGTKSLFLFRSGVNEFILVCYRHLGSSNILSIRTRRHIESTVLRVPGNRPIILDSPERRGYVFGYNETGSLSIVEYAID